MLAQPKKVLPAVAVWDVWWGERGGGGGAGSEAACLFNGPPSYKEITGGSTLCTPNQPSVAGAGGERGRSAARRSPARQLPLAM